MPVYTYICDKCDEVVERIKSVEDRDNKEPHPPCGSEMKRAITSPGRVWSPSRNEQR